MQLVDYSASEESDGSYEDGFTVQHGDGQHSDVSSEDDTPLAGLTAKSHSIDPEVEPTSDDAMVQSACTSSPNGDAPPPLVRGPPAEGADAEAAEGAEATRGRSQTTNAKKTAARA